MINAIDSFLRAHFQMRKDSIGAHSPQLLESMEYSLFNGGKRFRPTLSLTTVQGLGGEIEKALPWAAALEMVHTYSLIHDDLPCMDNDDERRGQPTNHKKYGEALALLAGDALLTESFLVLGTYYAQDKALPHLCALLGQASGASGMVGGQAMDMSFGESIDSISQIKKMHAGKTGALISAAVEGATWLAPGAETWRLQLKNLGDQLGLAFQIKDDLLDMEKDPRSYIYHLGVEGTQKALADVHSAATKTITQLPEGCRTLHSFVASNASRDK